MALALSAEAQDSARTVHLRDPLELDPVRIAVQHPPGDESFRAGLQGGAARVDSIEAWPIAGWSLVTLGPDSPVRGPELAERLAGGAADLFVAPVHLGRDGVPFWFTRDLVVRFDPRAGPERGPTVIAEQGLGEVLRADWGGVPGLFLVRTRRRSAAEVLDLARVLAERSDVLFAEPDAVLTGASSQVPNDPGFPQCWGLDNTGQSGGTPDADVDAPEAWDISTGDPSVIVVVLDTGVDPLHPDLNLIAGEDFTGEGGGGAPVNACDRHGTTVAGCVSARIDNGIGTVGVAPGCVTASARCFISTAACTGAWTAQRSWTADALFWAASIGARVTNNSNYYGVGSALIDQAYASTRAAGLVHFASAGNFSLPEPTYPASLPEVQAVAALDRDGVLTTFSNSGAGLALAAPGLDIYTTDIAGPGGYDAGDSTTASGTSYASPYAAGVAALALSVHPNLDAFEVESLLAGTAVDLGAAGQDPVYGWGFVNARAALEPLPRTYCSAKTSSAGCLPSMHAVGLPSYSSAAPFLAEATGVLNGKNGLLFYGFAADAQAFQGGVQCVASPVLRTPLQSSGGNPPPDDCSGSYSFDFNLWIQSGLDPLLVPGVEVFAQYWMRDPADPVGSGLSDGLRFTILP